VAIAKPFAELVLVSRAMGRGENIAVNRLVVGCLSKRHHPDFIVCMHMPISLHARPILEE
jgi:hypothetical protein